MEKSLIQKIKEGLYLDGLDPKSYSPLSLAYIGDAIYEIVIRTIVMSAGNMSVNKYHKKSSSMVKASAQKEVFEKIFEEDVDPKDYVEKHGLKTVNDEGALMEVLTHVIAENPKAVADFKNGKEKALGALVGQTMKAMKGKADPGLASQKLREMLR